MLANVTAAFPAAPAHSLIPPDTAFDSTQQKMRYDVLEFHERRARSDAVNIVVYRPVPIDRRVAKNHTDRPKGPKKTVRLLRRMPQTTEQTQKPGTLHRILERYIPFGNAFAIRRTRIRLDIWHKANVDQRLANGARESSNSSATWRDTVDYFHRRAFDK
ncbi:MAG: hypothetical protein JWP38_2434 [Herbaspirillum sp.]|jgi:hypothetical protein|nr:hypothetical protein [Herbaspirillum sp.]